MLNINENILFLTFDCCRYDSLKNSNAPFIKSIGELRLAKTHGTYTLPAHISFFMGYLPSVIDKPFNPYYTYEIKQLFRLSTARGRDASSIEFPLIGNNILDGFRNKGYKVIGAGGVRWFRHPLLQNFFDKFFFWGKTDAKSVFLQRKSNEFPLNHIDTYIKEIGGNNFFLFINCPETHCPYDFGEGIISNNALKVINEYSHIWGGKKADINNLILHKSDFDILHQSQISAIEFIDKKVEKLIALLPKPLWVIISGDHGECFGEDNSWGHGFAADEVMNVPIIINKIK